MGRKIGDVTVTPAGMLAAAHLVGNEGVKKFLDSAGSVDPKDGNGVSCSTYMKKFGGFKVRL